MWLLTPMFLPLPTPLPQWLWHQEWNWNLQRTQAFHVNKLCLIITTPCSGTFLTPYQTSPTYSPTKDPNIITPKLQTQVARMYYIPYLSPFSSTMSKHIWCHLSYVQSYMSSHECHVLTFILGPFIIWWGTMAMKMVRIFKTHQKSSMNIQ